MTEPDIILRDFLRVRLTDPNSSRVAGTPFIIDDWPYQTNLLTNHFPRISVINQFESGRPFGIGSTNVLSTVRLQLDIWVKPDQPLTISASPFEGFKQVRQLMRDISEAIRLYWISDLAQTNKVIYQISINWYPPKMVYEYNIVRQTGDISFVILRV